MKKWIFILTVLPTIAAMWFASKFIIIILNTATDGDFVAILTNPILHYSLFIVLGVSGVVNSIKAAQKFCDNYIKPEYH